MLLENKIPNEDITVQTFHAHCFTLRNEYKDAISILAATPRIHILASIDHINSPIRMYPDIFVQNICECDLYTASFTLLHHNIVCLLALYIYW